MRTERNLRTTWRGRRMFSKASQRVNARMRRPPMVAKGRMVWATRRILYCIAPQPISQEVMRKASSLQLNTICTSGQWFEQR